MTLFVDEREPNGAERQFRRELRYRVSDREADRLERLFEERLPLWPRFEGARETIVRSVYLDYPERSLTARALERPDESLKVRYKRYAAPRHIARTVDEKVVVWLEVKVRVGHYVTKERVPFPGSLVGSLLDREVAPPPDASALVEVLSGGTLEPVAAVRYRRVAFGGGALRVTIDRAIGFLRPERPGDSPPVLAELDGCVLEVKSENGVPAWLEAVLALHAPAEVSKFEAAVRAIGAA